MPGITSTGNGDRDFSHSPGSTGNPMHGSRSSDSDIKFTGKGSMDAGKVNSNTTPKGKRPAQGGIKFTGDGQKDV